MRAIQFILVGGLVALVVIYLRWFRSRRADRVIVLLFGVVGAAMVLMPESTNMLAQAIGVGRGADLVSYLGLIGLAFVCLILLSKLRQVEAQLTVLARAQAIAHARLPPGARSGSGDERPAAGATAAEDAN